jgi:hypothetical protein
MSSVYTPPPQITPAMLPYIAANPIPRGAAILINSSGQADIQDNSVVNPELAIGVSANSANTGEVVWVQFSNIITVQTQYTVPAGHFTGSSETVGPDLDDLGDPTAISLNNIAQVAVVGVALSQDGDNLTLLVMPIYFPTAAGGGSGPNFADAENPSGAIDGVNTTFTLANVPAAGCVPIIFQKTGGSSQQIPLVPGSVINGYSMVGNQIHMTDAPAAGSVIRVWYRF